MIKTFRGRLTDGEQVRLNIHTNNGRTGFRIKKLQLMPKDPDEDADSLFSIYKVEQTAISSSVDFSDNTLLGAAVYTASATSHTNPEDLMVIFDTDIFNQDIYLTLKGVDYSATLNWYIELEQMFLDLNEATVATLQSIRNA